LESDFHYGSITFTHPGGCEEVAALRLEVFIDGERFKTLHASATRAGAGTFSSAFPLDVQQFVFEPGHPTPHTLTLRASSTFVGNCFGIVTPTINELQINVLGLR
jgi:hypothetical protein